MTNENSDSPTSYCGNMPIYRETVTDSVVRGFGRPSALTDQNHAL